VAAAPLAVFEGAPSDATFLVGSTSAYNDSTYRDPTGPKLTAAGTARVVFTARAGKTYSFLVAGDGSIPFNLMAAPPPANDVLARAKPLSLQPGGAFQDVIEHPAWATNDVGDPPPPSFCSGLGGSVAARRVANSVWYELTTPADLAGYALAIDTQGSASTTVLAVFARENGALVLLPEACAFASNEVIDNAPTWFVNRLVFAPEAGKTYAIMVATWGIASDGIPDPLIPAGDNFGRVVFNASLGTPPPNDDFENATVMTLPFDDTVNTAYATSEAIDPPLGDLTIELQNTVWYRLDATVTAPVSLTTPATSFSTYIGVYTGAPGSFVLQASALSQVSSDQGPPLEMTFSAEQGVTYYVIVGTYHLWEGDFRAGPISLHAEYNIPPPNDDWSQPKIFDLSQGVFTDRVNNRYATVQDGEMVGFATVWYRFDATQSGLLRLRSQGAYFNRFAQVYDGTPPQLTPLTNGFCGWWYDWSPKDVPIEAGHTYYIQLGSLYGSNGVETGEQLFSAELVLPPPNDDIASATVVSFVAGTSFSDTVVPSDASTSNWETVQGWTACSVYIGGSVWYAYENTTALAQNLMMSTFGSHTSYGAAYDTVLAVFTGSPSALTALACNDDAYGPGGPSLVTFTAQPETTYYVLVGAWLPYQGAPVPVGTVTLTATLAP
jgi:hypothetical protein